MEFPVESDMHVPEEPRRPRSNSARAPRRPPPGSWPHATERDPARRGHRGMLASIKEAIGDALRRAQQHGDLDPGEDPAALAGFFVTFMNGVRVAAETNPDERTVTTARRRDSPFSTHGYLGPSFRALRAFSDPTDGPRGARARYLDQMTNNRSRQMQLSTSKIPGGFTENTAQVNGVTLNNAIGGTVHRDRARSARLGRGSPRHDGYRGVR